MLIIFDMLTNTFTLFYVSDVESRYQNIDSYTNYCNHK